MAKLKWLLLRVNFRFLVLNSVRVTIGSGTLPTAMTYLGRRM
jgi:hypothetical protein